MVDSLTTVGGWAVIAAAVGGIYWIQSRSDTTKRPQTAKQQPKQVEKKKESKAKKVKKDGNTSSNDNKSKKKADPKQVVQEPQAYANISSSKKGDRDEETDNREFARLMSQTKTGVVPASSKAKETSRQKSVKQSKAQEKAMGETSSDNASAPSSTTGGDADDDRSPINSPDLTAMTSGPSVTNGDVSDMLEKPAPGPSVLRVTEPITPAQPKKAKAPAAVTPAETKKQRQNKQKAEMKKKEREAAEQERKKLEEQQRRTARLAEGRAAKDGSGFMASKGPSSPAWTAPKAEMNGNGTPSPSKVELLDTLEQSTTKKSSSKVEPIVYSESEEMGSKWAGLPSEEDQMRFAVEESNDNWETVMDRKKKQRAANGTKKNNKAGNDKQSSADESKEYGVPPKIAPTGPGKKWEVLTTHVNEDGDVAEKKYELTDSEWEVS